MKGCRVSARSIQVSIGSPRSEHHGCGSLPKLASVRERERGLKSAVGFGSNATSLPCVSLFLKPKHAWRIHSNWKWLMSKFEARMGRAQMNFEWGSLSGWVETHFSIRLVGNFKIPPLIYQQNWLCDFMLRNATCSWQCISCSHKNVYQKKKNNPPGSI